MVASNKGQKKNKRNAQGRQPSPTREEIREACEKLQEDWDEREYEKRAGLKPKHWQVPRSDLQIDSQAQTN
ncbi:MAG: hypothetical protein HUJ26_22170 [Planctomycetaceae bacterium]|nr:hypothetical protein [Planctomycetaceae bacterium]